MNSKRCLLRAFLIALGLITGRCVQTNAQAPWQVPVAYSSPSATYVAESTSCYYPAPVQVQYQAYWPSTAIGCGVPSCSASSVGTCTPTTTYKPAGGDCCCCQHQEDPPAPPDPKPTPKPPADDDPPNPGNLGGEEEPNDANGLASYAIRRTPTRYAVSRTGSAISGKWNSKFGAVTLHQSGKVITGTMQYFQGGSVDLSGKYDLGVLTLSFQHRSKPSINGKVVFHYDPRSDLLAGKSRNYTSGREIDWSLFR